VSVAPEPATATLLAAAREALRDNRLAEAERLYEAVLAAEPDTAEALHHLGMRAFATGRLDEAERRLAHARRYAAGEASLVANHGIVLRAIGRLDEARVALRDAIRIEPTHFLARLQLGFVLEDLGRAREATAAFFGALTTAQRQGRWLNAQTTAPPMRPLVEHAIRAIDHGRARLFAELLAPLRAKHGMDAIRRVEKCLSIYLGALPAAYPDPRQKPLFLYLPDLPTVTFFDRALFPWYAVLEERAPAIRGELEAVMGDAAVFEPFLKFKPGQPTEEHLSGTRGEPHWDAYFFYRHGQRYDEHCARCPVTAAALDAVPLVRLRGHAPECLYSKLTPGSHIRPHHGVTNTRVVTHLPLVVPGDGALRVGGEDHAWQFGRCITFDDTFLHEAWNHSAHTRVVVLLDTWNPYMSAAEIDAFTTLVLAIRDFAEEATLADPMVDHAHG